MTDLRKAAEMSLEALEWSWGGEPLGTKEFEAITALRQALAQPEQDRTTRNGWMLREIFFQDGEPLGHREPPSKSWVSLTDDDLAECFVRKGRGLDKNEKFARLIEAALRSKNT